MSSSDHPGPSDQPAADLPGHPGTDRLADFSAGLLADAEAATLTAHTQRCDTCRVDLELLTGLPDRLADQAGASDTSMPPEVAGSIDAALAHEAQRATVPAPGAPATVVPLLPRATGGRPVGVRGMQILQAAAAVVLVLATGAVGVSFLHRGGASSPTSTAAGKAAPGSSAASAGGRIGASGRDWSPSTIRTAAGVLAGAEFGADSNGAPRLESAPSSDPARAPDSSGSSGSPGTSGSSVPSTAHVQRLADPVVLAGCLAALGTTDPAIAVDLARWNGGPAAVIVLPSIQGPTKLDIWVVGPTCGEGGDASMLDYQVVPRP